MISKEQLEKEKAFNEWLDSIKFIDENGMVVPAVLTKDESDDPEDYREGEE